MWPKAKAFLAEYHQALVSGKAFTDLYWQQFDMIDVLDPDVPPSKTKWYSHRNRQHPDTLGDPISMSYLLWLRSTGGISDDEWAAICSRWDSILDGSWLAVMDTKNEGHHPYQWWVKRLLEAAGKDPWKMTEIALNEDTQHHRRTLELARVIALVQRNELWRPVFTINIDSKYPLDLVLQAEENQQALKALLAPSTWKGLKPHIKTLYKLAAMFSKAGDYSTFTCNIGKDMLDRYKEKGKANRGKSNGREAWHKRVAQDLRVALGPDVVFSFTVERDNLKRWHVHGIAYGIHSETFKELYEAELKRVFGTYTPAAEENQIHIDGGYGFEGMLSWIGYMTKDKGSILFETHEQTAAGKELFAYVKAKQAEYNTRNVRSTCTEPIDDSSLVESFRALRKLQQMS